MALSAYRQSQQHRQRRERLATIENDYKNEHPKHLNYLYSTNTKRPYVIICALDYIQLQSVYEAYSRDVELYLSDYEEIEAEFTEAFINSSGDSLSLGQIKLIRDHFSPSETEDFEESDHAWR